MNNKKIAKRLNKIAKQLLSYQFPNQKALNKYLKQHPLADRKNHKVIEFKPKQKQEEQIQEKYKVVDKNELKEIIKNAADDEDLNMLDVSNITDMSNLFSNTTFNGNISEWDISKVKNMTDIFNNSKFNGDISNWNLTPKTEWDIQGTNSRYFKKWSEGAKVLNDYEINDYEFKEDETIVVQAYHGTTFEFDEFKLTDNSSKEGHFGSMHYFSSDLYDVENNYKGVGVDLKNKIENRKEELDDEFELDSDYDKIKEHYNLPDKFDEKQDFEEIKNYIVETTVKGNGENVLPVYIKLKNPFVLGQNQEHYFSDFDEESEMDDILYDVAINNDINIDDLDKKELESFKEEHEGEIQDEIYNRRNDSDDDLYNACEKIAWQNDLELSDVLPEDYYGENITSEALEEMLRNKLQDVETYDGGMGGRDYLSQIIEELGFDSIVMKNADDVFSNMTMNKGTTHIHIFDEKNNQIKHEDNNGEFSNSSNIYAESQNEQ